MLAAALGAVIGLVLALTGAGGGVLAIPLLIFGLELHVQQAAPIGLAAVGIASAVGAVLGLRDRVVRYRAAAMIGLAGIIVAPLGVALAQRLPGRPLTGAFALLLVWTAWRMLRAAPVRPTASVQLPPCRLDPAQGRLRWTWRCARALAGTGAVSGLFSGLLGVGGGFVIVPSLTRNSDLDARSIQATSLAVIALVSVSGVSAAVLHGALDWSVAAPFAGGATLALLAGRRLALRLRPARLRQFFAWTSVAVAVLMGARALGPG